jgi:hypothetical protein
MDSQRFRALTPHNRALVAVALLLDGREAHTYLEIDAISGTGMKRAALDMCDADTELRIPFLGTMLRIALEELETTGR